MLIILSPHWSEPDPPEWSEPLQRRGPRLLQLHRRLQVQPQVYTCTQYKTVFYKLVLNIKPVLWVYTQFKMGFCTLVLNIKPVLWVYTCTQFKTGFVSVSASASSTMTTRAPEEESLTCATAPMVSLKDYDIIILRSSSKKYSQFSGKTFKPENVVNNAVDKFGIPNCGRNQVCVNTSSFSTRN